MRLSALLALPLLLIAGCGNPGAHRTSAPPPQVIPGTALPIRLSPDSTWVPLDDFIPGVQAERISWQPDWATGIDLVPDSAGNERGVWIHGQPVQGFGALGLTVGGRTAHIPVLASSMKKVSFALAPGYESRQDVRIMGGFNGWSRLSQPLTQGSDGRWRTSLTLPEGKHAYQLIIDGEEMPDPANPDRVDNGFGGYNSMLTVASSGPTLALNAIGFGGNQVHDVRLLGAPGARVWAWWENQLYNTTILGEDGTGMVRIPAAAYGAGRTNLRLWASGKGQPSREVRIPLLDGLPITSPTALTREDWEAQVMYFMMVDRFRNADPQNDRPLDDPEVHPRANDHGGDLAGVRAALDAGYFQELGVTALWLSPLTRNPDKAYGYWTDPSTDVTSRFSGYHGYWPVSNTALDPRFGTRETFDGLVDAAHDNGMNFLLDYVANHVHEAHPLYAEHPDWATNLYLPDGRENTQLWDDERLTTWFDTFMPTLDLRREDVAGAMSDSAVWWIANSGIDGFRHDATKHIPLSFWRMLTRKVKSETAGSGRRVFQIGETYGSAELISSYLGTGLLDAQFDFNLYDKAILAFGKDGTGVEELARVAQEGLDVYGAHHLMGTITGNQDRPRFASLAEGTVRWDEDHKLAGWTREIRRDGVRGHQAMRMLTAFNMSMPGVPCIYQGDEYADVGGNDPDNRRMMRFDDLDLEEMRTRDITAAWIALRRSRMSMVYGQTRLEVIQPEVLKITREYLDEATTIIINTGATPVQIEGLSDDQLLLGRAPSGSIAPLTAVAIRATL